MDNCGNLRDLLRRAKNGDVAAFGAVYEGCFNPIYRYILIRVRNRPEAEDLAQTVFLKAFASLKSFEERAATPMSYLFKIARNAVIDHWKKRKERVFSDMGDEEDNENSFNPAGDDSPVRRAEESERSRAIKKAILGLTEEQQSALTMRFVNDLTTKEIAEAMGKKEPTVRQLQCRALRALKEKLKNLEYEARRNSG